MALEFMSKAFQLNNTTPTNNNQRSSSNPCYNQIAQSGMKIDQDRHILMVDNNVGNQFRQNAVQNDAAYLHKQMQIAQKEEAGIQLTFEEFDFMAAAGACEGTESDNANYTLEDNLQQASTSGTQSDKAPVYDTDRSAENDSNVMSEVSSLEQGERTVEKHPANVEETRALYDSLYNNLEIEVEKVNTVNRKLRETNAELTTRLARYKNQEKCFEISQEKHDKLESGGHGGGGGSDGCGGGTWCWRCGGDELVTVVGMMR
uniref:Uncharacterized protein n=1 Tax=Tanacetum cinerariifolium TaxID=118510 RepID=A0A6L2KHE9_TANCI|nr:hypothetical protein [Tanacetum cinerariifolium]